MNRFLTLIASCLLLAVVIPAIAADKKDKQKTTTRSVQGVVTDSAEDPLDGAVVQLKDLKSLQVRSYITKANGQFVFYGLNPDIDYEVKADHKGSSTNTRTLSSFDSRKQAILNLKVEKK